MIVRAYAFGVLVAVLAAYVTPVDAMLPSKTECGELQRKARLLRGMSRAAASKSVSLRRDGFIDESRAEGLASVRMYRRAEALAPTINLTCGSNP